MSTKNQVNRTSDMYFAAALLAYGCKLSNVDRTDPKHQIFEFAGTLPQIVIMRDEKLLEIVENLSFNQFQQEFLNDRVWLPPAYISALRKVKNMIMSYVD